MCIELYLMAAPVSIRVAFTPDIECGCYLQLGSHTLLPRPTGQRQRMQIALKT